jgi:hypothetical protein
LKQLKLDVAAWVKSAAEVLPGQAEVERGVEEVGSKLNELQMKMRSSAGDGGKTSSSASPDLLDDMTALAALISRAHNVCLLRQAFTSAALPLQQHHILNALKFIRDHHVAAVARILHAPLSFAAARNGMLQSFKFEGLEAALFDLPEISGCVQVGQFAAHGSSPPAASEPAQPHPPSGPSVFARCAGDSFHRTAHLAAVRLLVYARCDGHGCAACRVKRDV